ncbi:MAG TPA: NTP transferase domain-containing protein, partial [Candidatus Sulfotelmatobacter sp.]|nr:NTP transferase domain-containing protein [Candidatus Sulfotelmatobacter sp.]
LATLRQAGIEEIFISGRAGTDYSGLHCPVLVDVEPGFGPVAGIERGLHAVSSPLLLVLAVDLPKMTAAFLNQLAAHCDPLTGAVPKLNGELEPLAAIYPKRCHVLAMEFLARWRHAAREFAAACLRERAMRTFAVSPKEAGCFENWNSPQDLGKQTGETPRPALPE